MEISITDDELIKRFQEGEDAAFGPIIKRYSGLLFTLTYNSGIRDSTAEDIVHDVFFKAMQSIKDGGYHHTGNMKAWLCRIAFNCSMDHYRKKNRIPSRPDEKGVVFGDKHSTLDFESHGAVNKVYLLPDYNDNPEEALIKLESIQKFNDMNFDVRETIFAMFDKLPKKQAAVLSLRYFFNLSYEQIMMVEEISLGTALSRVRYGLAGIRNMLSGVPEEIIEGLKMELE